MQIENTLKKTTNLKNFARKFGKELNIQSDIDRGSFFYCCTTIQTFLVIASYQEWQNHRPGANKSTPRLFQVPFELFLNSFIKLCRYPSYGHRLKNNPSYLTSTLSFMLTFKTCHIMCSIYVTIVVNSFFHKYSLFMSIYVHYNIICLF